MDVPFKIKKRLETLQNGATIIEQDGDVVLAMWDRSGMGREFVTWKVDRHGDAYLGHYFRSITDAVADFTKRAANEVSGRCIK